MFITLDEECSESEDSVHEHNITAELFARLTRKGSCKAVRVLIRPFQGESRSHNGHPKNLGTLLKYYRGVFTGKLQRGLVPKRTVKTTLDLKRAAKPKV